MAGDWLLLRVPDEAGVAPEWAAADASGALLPLPGRDAASLVQAASGRQVALLAPAGEVALFSVPLPPGNEARLLQLAPFALEEQVSEDLADLHFAVGQRDGGSGQVPVAVVGRERMRSWLAFAGSLGLTPRAVFAESDLAPVLPGHITMMITADSLILRQDRARPVVFPADDVELALSTLLGADADLSQMDVAVYVRPEDWPHQQRAVEALRDRVASLRVQLSGGGLLGLYAQGISSTAPINLLQGEFKPQSGSGVSWQRWRVAAMLLGGLLLLQMAASMLQLYQLNKTSAELQESVARVYGTLFPGQQPGASPRRIIDARLKAVAGGGSPQGELMPLLAAVAAARQNVPVTRLDALTFKPGALQLRLSAPDAATLEQFSQALRAGGMSAQVSSGTQREGGFEGQIDLESGT